MTGPDPGTAGPLQRVLAELATRYPAEDTMVPDLDRIRLLCDLLGSPQKSYPAIHLTGTNGKSSTARMVDALLQAFGLRPGRYTSPHLDSVTERITLDGQPITEERFAEVWDEIAPFVELVDSRMPQRMTFFEVLTGMAFAAFADAPVDVAVLEVGLGGLWDATNVVDAGDGGRAAGRARPRAAAGHDAGRDRRPRRPGSSSRARRWCSRSRSLRRREVLLRRCVEVGATVAREGLEFGVVDRVTAVGGQLLSLQGLGGRYDEVFLPLHGAHQAANAAAALAAVEAFLGGGDKGMLDPELVREGFARVASPGRLEVVRTSPTVLLDAAHNAHGMTATVAALGDAFAFTHLVAVVAVLGDKDAKAMLEVLEPAVASVVVTQNGSPRAMPVDDARRPRRRTSSARSG